MEYKTEFGAKADVRSDLLSDAEFEHNCARYADWALYMPPEKFLFHHYDESPDKPLICHRPMADMERYVVNDLSGGFYGIYDTRDVGKNLKTGTWIELPSGRFFAEADIAVAKANLDEAKARLAALGPKVEAHRPDPAR